MSFITFPVNIQTLPKFFPIIVLGILIILIVDKWVKIRNQKSLQQNSIQVIKPSVSIITKSQSNSTINTNSNESSIVQPSKQILSSTSSASMINNNTTNISSKTLLHILYSNTHDASYYALGLKSQIESVYPYVYIHYETLDNYSITGEEKIFIFITEGNNIPKQFNNRKLMNKQLRFAIFHVISRSISVSETHHHENNAANQLYHILTNQWKSQLLLPIRTCTTELPYNHHHSHSNNHQVIISSSSISLLSSKSNQSQISLPSSILSILNQHTQFQAWIKNILQIIERYKNIFFTTEEYNMYLQYSLTHTSSSTVTSSASVPIHISNVIENSNRSSSIMTDSSLTSSNTKLSSTSSNISTISKVSVEEQIQKFQKQKLLEKEQRNIISPKTMVSSPPSLIGSNSQTNSPNAINNTGILNISATREKLNKLNSSSANKTPIKSILSSSSTNSGTKNTISPLASLPINIYNVQSTLSQVKDRQQTQQISAAVESKDNYTIPIINEEDHYHTNTINLTSTTNTLPVILNQQKIFDTIEKINETSLINHTIDRSTLYAKMKADYAQENKPSKVTIAPVSKPDTSSSAAETKTSSSRFSISKNKDKETDQNKSETSNTDTSTSRTTSSPSTTKAPSSDDSSSSNGTNTNNNPNELPDFIKLLNSIEYNDVIKGAKLLSQEFIQSQKHVFTTFKIDNNKAGLLNDPLSLAGLLYELVIPKTDIGVQGSQEVYELLHKLFTVIRIKGDMDSVNTVVKACEPILQDAKRLDDKYMNHPGRIHNITSSMPCGPFTILIMDSILARCLKNVFGELKNTDYTTSEILPATACIISELIKVDKYMTNHIFIRRYLGYIYTICPLLIPVNAVPDYYNTTTNYWRIVEAAATLHGHVMHANNIHFLLSCSWNSWSFFARIMKYFSITKITSPIIFRLLTHILTPLTCICFPSIIHDPIIKNNKLVRGYGKYGIRLLKTYFLYIQELDKIYKTKFTNHYKEIETYFSITQLYYFLGGNKDVCGDTEIQNVKVLENHIGQPGGAFRQEAVDEDDVDNTAD